MQKKLSSYRLLNLLGLALCISYLAGAFWMEVSQGLQPCPLCVMQRWVMLFLLVMFLLASLHISSTLISRVYMIITLTASSFGMILSGRNIWLQISPPEGVGVCMPNITYLFKQLPLDEALKTLVWGGGDCATVTGQLFGVTLPWWTFLGFLFLFIISLFQATRESQAA